MGLLSVLTLGILGRKKKRKRSSKPETGRSPGSAPFVKVAFTDLHREPSPGAKGYAYRWTLPGVPKQGDRVWVPGLGGLSAGIVLRVTRTPGYSGEIENVARRATPAEISKSIKDDEKSRQKRINAWRADRGSSTGASAASDFPDLRALRRNKNALVRGRHYTEWVEPIRQMKRDGSHVEAVQLLRECQAATLRVDGERPAPWYFVQEAIICRKDKHYAAEVAVLQRYLDACSGEPHRSVAERIDKARGLAEKYRNEAGTEALDQDNQDSGGD